jgi:hypothetical protein
MRKDQGDGKTATRRLRGIGVMSDDWARALLTWVKTRPIPQRDAGRNAGR